MRRVKRLIWLIVLLFAGLMLVQMVASETGEVVVLATRGEAEEAEETRLWVVDYEGH